ncbi:MAG TPA: carboxypeptidase regulatory-like domain-containing protein [Bryobacteraceae bacterium]|nr:carboxypeptidase regulatory-like domain-containing protein [Bryobacteraceae bacterium]
MPSRHFSNRLIVPCVAILGLATCAHAQQVFGSIYGSVTDPSSAAVINAKVTISDVNKGTKFEVQTDSAGNYNKGQLIPDTYTVEIEAAGFAKVKSDPLEVHVDQASRFDAKLKVGDVATEVEVSAAVPLLETDRSDVAQTFSAKEINDLPNIGRNLQSMELLNPGTAKIGWQHASDENPQGSVQMIVNGQLFDSMGYELDGTTNQDPILGIIVINPTFDSINEVKQANQNFDAEFAYVGGGIASYSTKSGTNQIHGDAFEYLQLNTPGFTTFAANPFTNLPSAVYRQNQFGGSLGGYVKKDKLFYFADMQLNRQSQGASVVTSVPDALNRTGNFSDWLAYNPIYQLYDPTTGNPSTGVGRTPYPDNVIPASQLSSQAKAIMAYWPLPNFQQISGAPFVNNYAVNGAVAIHGNQWNTRWDYYLDQKDTIFGRYSYAGFTEAAPGAFGEEAGGPQFGNYAGNSQALNQSLAIGWTRSFSPTLINEVRFGWMRYHVFDVPNGYGTEPAQDAGIPGLNLDKTYTSGMPYFNVTSPNDSYQLGYALGVNQCNCPLTQTERQYQFVDNLTKVVGKHNLKFGADLRYAQNLRVPSDSHRAGELTFNGGVTGNVAAAGQNEVGGVGLATFLLGDVTNFNRYVSSSTNAQESQPRLFWYGQDEWRPDPKLTINLGLRWELTYPESVNAAGNGATLDLANGLMYVFGVGGVSMHGIQQMNYHHFAPRVGLAYQLRPKTVVRAGYGWSYDLGVFGSNFGHNVTQNPPVLSNQSIQPPNGFTDVFTLAQGPSTLAPITVSSNGTFPLPAGINPKFRPASITFPTVYQYNAAIQHQLTNKIALTGAYVGNADRHGFMGTSNTINPNEASFVPGVSNTNLDRPYYSTFGWTNDLSYYCDCANERYNSFQGNVLVQAWQGWTLQGSYTYQRQWGDGWGYDSNYYFLYDRAAGEGYSNTLPRGQLTLSQIYDIPYGHGRKYGSTISKGLDYAIGGWTLSGITTYYTGFGFSPTLENYGSAGGQPNQGPNNRPNLGTGNPYAGAQGNRAQWFVGCPNQNCTSGPFLFPSANAFGNYPINTLFGPRFIQQDLTIAKNFHFSERVMFQLRTDASNAFNHTNLGLPNSDVQSPSVGQITGLAGGGSMRRLQFSGTIRF